MDKYIVYKTTNILNNKIYIGVHNIKTTEFDGYLGSGTYLGFALRYFGEENFIRETLFTYDKKELVDLEFINDVNTYNLALGGIGESSASVTSSKKLSEYSKLLITVSESLEIEYKTEILESGEVVYSGAFILPQENLNYFLYKVRRSMGLTLLDSYTLRCLLLEYAYSDKFKHYYNPKNNQVYTPEKYQLLFNGGSSEVLTEIHINSYRRVISKIKNAGIIEKEL